ncbi:hypothetical protein [Clostridium sp.]|uniref:hypothetical protein n=1 Tax=Clostridium sp. TaxID=1506 RepID=UPI003F3C8325
MRKKGTLIFALITVILLIGIVVVVLSMGFNESKEIKASKEFLTLLQDDGAIDSKININNVEYGQMAKASNLNSKIKFTTITENYGLDLDEKYNVIGFSKKSQETNNLDNPISEEKARALAEDYVGLITQEEVKFKEVRKLEGENESAYTVIFYKCNNGHPYYEHEIITKINKYTGFLEGYSNYPLDDIEYITNINTTEEEAKIIAEEHLLKLKIAGEIKEKPLLAYVKINDKEMELAYIFIVDSSNANNEEDKYKIFVGSSDGKILSVGIKSLEAASIN